MNDQGRLGTPDHAGTVFGTLARIMATTNAVRRGQTNHQRMEGRLPMSNAERIIRLKTVLARTGLSRATLYRKIGEGTFPRQVRISIHGAGWHESAVNRWIGDPASYRADDGNAAMPRGGMGHGEG